MFLLLWWEYRVCVCVQICRERGKRGSMFNLHIAFVCWDESEQAGGNFRMHMRVWRVEAVGLWSGGFLVVLDASGPEPECHIPFSG